ncbi:Toluene efflux pump periplasmic linker protein TtgG precursor [Symmachiella macrocystis]|uniref:Toluene efflux pump periplasmic linker protein TtgG n=1 Tax=Symmachiella macrocystis TaxID=2527985 RepID=A0A5C6BE86_9PLAN|nr:efflux RND transporter periplasmic adaptor subunit [Symmachiella macrocystis]TWU09596.1 Toluene efflux pump periplasmic linker protein TtgG precursor [Symmachiella macrocystis]
MTNRQKPTRRSIVWSASVIFIAAVAVGIAAAANSPQSEQGAAEKKSVPVNFIVAKQVSEFEDVKAYTGTIAAERVSELAFARAGRLTKIFVDEGEDVYQGKCLAQLDIRHLEAQRSELQAQRAQAAALLEEYLAGPRKETISAARADVTDMRSQFEHAQASHQRNEDLYRRKVISKEDFDRSNFGLRSAKAKYESTQRKLDELLAGTRKEKITAQRAAVSRLDAALKDLAVDVDDAHLIAPFEGRIAIRHMDEGTYVSPNTSVFRYVEIASLEARIGLPVDIARTIHTGMQQDVVIGDRTYSATVKTVLPELDITTRTRTVVLALDAEAAETVVPGEVARISIPETVRMAGYWLPTAALSRSSRGLWSVLVIDNLDDSGTGTAEQREIEILHAEGERMLVRGTLQPGDRVITGGTHRIVAGQTVRGMIQ